MIPINEQILKQALADYDASIQSMIDAKKTAVEEFLAYPTRIVDRVPTQFQLSQLQRDYTAFLLANFKRIVLADNAKLVEYKNSFNKIIDGGEMARRNNTQFRDELVKRMGYAQLREAFYPQHFERIGIKSCVYCNCQFALIVVGNNRQKEAKFQVDHFLPKKEYPCFSISFYNLYPVCSSCNNTKSAGAVDFNLYASSYSEYSKSPFSFRIEKASLIKYRVNGDVTQLQIKFEEPPTARFDETFAVESIYNTQKDIAEELILKSMIYNKTYTDQLRKTLRKLYHDKTPMFERLLTGNYTSERDIHKRPMSKFMQDIAKQVGLL
jgi:hypothetical protein